MSSRTLADVLDDLRFAMVGTPHTDGTWQSRPLTMAGQDEDRLAFLVSVQADWVRDMPTAGSAAGVTFSDPGENTYVALQGDARVLNDRDRIAELWNVGAESYFDGADDPDVRILEVTVSHGEWWDGPSGRIGQLVQLASAALGKEVGDQGDVQL